MDISWSWFISSKDRWETKPDESSSRGTSFSQLTVKESGVTVHFYSANAENKMG